MKDLARYFLLVWCILPHAVWGQDCTDTSAAFTTCLQDAAVESPGDDVSCSACDATFDDALYGLTATSVCNEVLAATCQAAQECVTSCSPTCSNEYITYSQCLVSLAFPLQVCDYQCDSTSTASGTNITAVMPGTSPPGSTETDPATNSTAPTTGTSPPSSTAKTDTLTNNTAETSAPSTDDSGASIGPTTVVLNYNGTLDDTASLEEFSAYTVCTDGEDYAGDAEACDACTTTEAASSGVTDSTPCPDLIEAAKTVVDICGDTCVPPECSDLYTAWTVCIIQLSEACDAYGTIGGDEANGGSNNNPGGSGASDNGGGSSNACRSMASVAVVAATAAAVPLLTML